MKIAIDDTILVKGFQTTCGSKILEGFKPLFSAEVVTRLESNGCEITKTPVGEFGLDLVGEFSYGNEQTGVLHGAAAEAVKAGTVDAGIGVDMTGATRRAAALSDVLFLKPTYGTVSRYGIISCAASGEQVGAYAKDTATLIKTMDMIAGHDCKDGTSLPAEKYDYKTVDTKGKKIALIKNLYDKADAESQKKIDAFVATMKASGVEVTEITLEYAEEANIAWQILMTAETCNNVSRFDGVKYGHRSEHYKNIDELYINSRTEGFNFLTKSVILYGSDVLSKGRYEDCYEKSLKIRRIVADYMKTIFEQYDAVLMPVCSKSAYESYDIKDAFQKVFEESIFTAIANLIGIPALVGEGVQLMGSQYSEGLLLSFMKTAEERRA